MAYGTPTDPVPGTVITVAYAASNILDPIRWLRLLTGNADPPGSNYVVVSTSTSGTSWMKVPADALAAGVAVANLGYTPINKAGDSGIGALSVLGISAGLSGIDSLGGYSASSGAGINVGHYDGGSTAAGSPSVLGLTAGASGISSAGGFSTPVAITPGWYAGGSLGIGTPAVLGLTAGANGIDSAGGYSSTAGGVAVGGTVQGTRLISTVATGTAPLTVASATTVANLRAATAVAADSATTAAACSGNAATATNATTAATANAVAALSVTDAGVAAANKDGVVGTPSMRTIGTGAQQAAAGNHTHSQTGTFTGQGAGINAAFNTATNFSPRFTVITGSDDSSFLLVGTAEAIGNTAGLAALCTGTHNGTNLFRVDVAHGGPNQTGVSYTWTAFA